MRKNFTSPNHPIALSPHNLIVLSLAGVTRIAIDIRLFLLMAIQTPGHIVSIDHLYRPLFFTCKAMTDGTINTALNMNPVGKNNKFRKFIHSLPGNLSPCLDILHHFKRLGPLADRIGCMAGTAKVNIRNACGTVPFHITMAESTIQI